MSTFAGELYHPVNGSPEKVWTGFSWPCLFFGGFWYIYKGIIGWGIISLLLALATSGLSWLVFPFFANEHYRKKLVSQGYLSAKQMKLDSGMQARFQSSSHTSVVSQPATSLTGTGSVADELTKLGKLRVEGLLTVEEFEAQKRKLLGT